MGKFIDLTGQKFRHLTVIKRLNSHTTKDGKVHQGVWWLCECDCNPDNPNLIEANASMLRSGNTGSCGCAKNSFDSNYNKNNKSKPMKDNPTLELNLKDDTHELYGRCKTYNTDEWFYFSMCDYDLVKDYCWNVKKRKDCDYICLQGRINDKMTRFHRVIGLSDPDHINRNPLDNRRENLNTSATRSEQCLNRKRFKNNKTGCTGVIEHCQTGIFYSTISVNKKKINLGSFKNKRDAIIARLNAEIKYLPEYAWQTDLINQYKGELNFNNE